MEGTAKTLPLVIAAGENRKGLLWPKIIIKGVDRERKKKWWKRL